MAQIKYAQFGNRILAADDLKKAGVEGFTKRLFVNDTPVEVEDEHAKAILDHPELFGKFEEVKEDDTANQLDLPTATGSESESNATVPAKASRKQ